MQSTLSLCLIFLTVTLNSWAMRTPLADLPQEIKVLRSKEQESKIKKLSVKYKQWMLNYERDKVFFHWSEWRKRRQSMG